MWTNLCECMSLLNRCTECKSSLCVVLQENRRRMKQSAAKGAAGGSGGGARAGGRRKVLLAQHYWHRLLGTALGWFAWDFYYCARSRHLLEPQLIWLWRTSEQHLERS